MEPSDAFGKKLGLIVTELARVGEFLIDKGHYERAIDVFLVLSEGDPIFEAGSYAYDIGVCYEKLNNLSKARQYFEIAARESPEMPKYAAAAANYGSATK